MRHTCFSHIFPSFLFFIRKYFSWISFWSCNNINNKQCCNIFMSLCFPLNTVSLLPVFVHIKSKDLSSTKFLLMFMKIYCRDESCSCYCGLHKASEKCLYSEGCPVFVFCHRSWMSVTCFFYSWWWPEVVSCNKMLNQCKMSYTITKTMCWKYEFSFL